MARTPKPKTGGNEELIHISISNVEKSVKKQLERIARKHDRTLASYLRVQLRELARNGTATS